MIRITTLCLLVTISTPVISSGGDKLVESAIKNDIPFLKKSIENGASVNSRNFNNTTILMAASINGHKQLVEFLLKNGANPNIENLQGIAPLYGACMLGHAEVVKLLLNNGANPNAKINKPIATPLMSAVVNYRTKIISLLLKNGANINIKNSEGKTALELAKNEEVRGLLGK